MSRAVRSGEFWLLAATFAICGFTTMGLIGTHFVPYAVEHGFTGTERRVLGGQATAKPQVGIGDVPGHAVVGVADHVEVRAAAASGAAARGVVGDDRRVFLADERPEGFGGGRRFHRIRPLKRTRRRAT